MKPVLDPDAALTNTRNHVIVYGVYAIMSFG
jgi:hypothetical protein